MFVYRLALELGVWNVEEWKKEISLDQLKKWLAFYRLEPWGQPWRMMGRAVAFIRAAFGVKIDRIEYEEQRFLPTYRQGDEYDVDRIQTDEEIAERLSAIPGMKPKAN